MKNKKNMPRGYKRYLRQEKVLRPLREKLAALKEEGKKYYTPKVKVYTVGVVEKKFGCKLETKHGILPMTKLPNSNLVAESVLLLSNNFWHFYVISSAIIVASEKDLPEEEKKVIENLIKKLNNSSVSDDEGYMMPSCSVSIVSPNQRNSKYEYFGLKSTDGFCFDLIDDMGTFWAMNDSNPRDMFFAKVIEFDE